MLVHGPGWASCEAPDGRAWPELLSLPRGRGPLKPRAFRYVAARSAEEALEALDAHGDEAKVLAGGQSLVPMMNLRLASPGLLVDLNRVPDLSYVREVEGGVAIGAMTRQRLVEQDPVIRRRAPLVAAGLRHVGHFQIRNRGTVGGSIAHADAAAELPAILLALDGEVTVRSLAAGSRRIAAADLFHGYFTTALRPDEILTEVFFPAHPPGSGWSFRELARRHGDFALAGVAVVLQVAGNRLERAAISLLGVGGAVVRAVEAEGSLAGMGLEEELAERAEAHVRDELHPIGNLHGSSDYRRHLAAVLTRRTVTDALERAGR